MVYREVPLDRFVDEPDKVTMHIDSSRLKDMLSDSKIQSSFTLNRYNTNNGERILAYSIANPRS